MVLTDACVRACVSDASSLTLVGEKQQAHDDWVKSVGFNGEGTRIVSGGIDKAIKLWGTLGGLLGGGARRGQGRWGRWWGWR